MKGVRVSYLPGLLCLFSRRNCILEIVHYSFVVFIVDENRQFFYIESFHTEVSFPQDGPIPISKGMVICWPAIVKELLK